MPNRPSLATRIKIARKTAGLSQGALARKIGVSRAAVSQWENGTIQSLEMGNLFGVADACEINARWLALGTGSPSKGNATPDERHLLELYRAMPDPMKERLVSIAVDFQPVNQPQTKAAPFHAPPPQKVGKGA